MFGGSDGGMGEGERGEEGRELDQGSIASYLRLCKE